MNKIVRGIISAVLCATFFLNYGAGADRVFAENDLKTAISCYFVIPGGFVKGQEKGVFVNENAPMESSTIRYSYYDNGRDKVLTNREKQAIEDSGVAEIIDESLNLTKDMYQNTVAAAYTKEYGSDVGFSVESFDKIKVDGYPGFKIKSNFKAPDEERIYQTTFIIISKYRVFTLSLQRAEDDDCEDVFEQIEATIHVR
jgi:hypothetical protein